jgi:hypothetical protein
MRQAWHGWEQFDPPFTDGPHLLPEVVAALLALPQGQVAIRKILKPPSAWYELKGTVFGVRFQLIGQLDGKGDWSHVWELHPIGPED